METPQLTQGTSQRWPSLMLRWHEGDKPLPVRFLRSTRSEPSGPAFADIPPWLTTGPSDRPFDFTSHMRRLLADVVARSPELGHIEPSRILLCVLQARHGRGHGLQARVTPLRFPGGQLVRQRRGVSYQVQRYFLGEVEFLYVMTFCLPRFLDQDFDDKFITLCHELYHIGPECNGDLRRHHGRYQLHTHSQRCYDGHMAELARAYLASGPDPSLHDFLRLTFDQLERKHGAVTGVAVPRPKVIPLLSLMPAAASRP